MTKTLSPLVAVFVLIALAGCGNLPSETEAWPEDLSGKEQLLKEKRNQLAGLQDQIDQLEQEIRALRPASEQKKRLVTTRPVQRSDFDHFVEIQATVQSDDIINVSSEVPGRIVGLSVREGDQIRKGALIASLDLEQIDKQIAELQTSLDLAREVYERQKRLWDQNIGSEIQYLQAENNMERLERSLETIQVQKSKGKIYAPISGVVEHVLLKSGELASPGMPIVQLINTGKVKVVAEVSENYLRAVGKGDQVKIRFPALDLEKEARISLVGKTINPANRTFSVEVELSNPDGLLKPNLLALMAIRDYSVDDAVTVPLEIVQQEANGESYVMVRDQGEHGPIARKIYVETGKSYQGEILITKGLQGGEELIMEGARTISENELIEVINQKG